MLVLKMNKRPIRFGVDPTPDPEIPPKGSGGGGGGGGGGGW
ncbi:MAG: hypothetical protein PHT40_01795 [Patescibacteria group bacterium]|nr:hypothetical protein [Patescibacteria group bacterium]